MDCTTQRIPSEIKKDSFRLRYKVYCEEMGLSSPNASHDSKEIKDAIDDHAIIVNYYKNNVCASTFRVNILSDGTGGVFEDLYNIDLHLGRDKLAVLTKLMVHPNHRKSRASYYVVRDACMIGLIRSVRYAYIDCAPDLMEYYEKWGFVINGEPFNHYETGHVTPMRLDYDNIDYLRSIKSPCAKIYDEFNTLERGSISFSSRCENTWQ